LVCTARETLDARLGYMETAEGIWDKPISQWAPANFGLTGDRTQHLLWRIENAELDAIPPKLTESMK